MVRGPIFRRSITEKRWGAIMKYIRFQGLQKTVGISSQCGVFQLAYKLKNSPEITAYDDHELRKHLAWLEMHLKAPTLDEKPGSQRAIFWFRDRALEPINRIRSIKAILVEYGFWVEQITCENPGYVLYEDGWQVAAKPFRR